MMDRCHRQTSNGYPRYGGRGIIVCDDWNGYLIDFGEAFVNFKIFAESHGYNDNLSIDRIDNDGNYCPNNCRWTTNNVQSKNHSRNKYLTINNITKTIHDWLKDPVCKCSKFTFYNRINNGWDAINAITTPTRRTKDK